MSKNRLKTGLWGLLWVLIFGIHAWAQQSWNLSRAAKWIAQETPYRFLYRETFASQFMIPKLEDPQAQLELILRQLPRLGVEVLLDTTYKHILIFERNESVRTTREIIFTLFDDKTSERLAYVPVQFCNQQLVTDEAGRLSLQLGTPSTDEEITFSYLGYESIRLKLPKNRGLYYLSIRLKPDPIWGEEVWVFEKNASQSSFLLHKLESPVLSRWRT